MKKQTLDITEIFDKYPELHITGVAKRIGINGSLLRQYVSGIKMPSAARKKRIEIGLHELAKELLNARINLKP